MYIVFARQTQCNALQGIMIYSFTPHISNPFGNSFLPLGNGSNFGWPANPLYPGRGNPQGDIYYEKGISNGKAPFVTFYETFGTDQCYLTNGQS